MELSTPCTTAKTLQKQIVKYTKLEISTETNLALRLRKHEQILTLFTHAHTSKGTF